MKGLNAKPAGYNAMKNSKSLYPTIHLGLS